MRTRIIAKLDVKPPHVVKPIHFEGLRKIGNPSEIAENYYSQGADEIFYIDIVASLYKRKILFDSIEKVANKLFIPFAVGGGVNKIEDFKRLFQMGADKVILNTYAVQSNPNLINESAEIFGNQAVVVNIEAKKIEKQWQCYTDGGKIQSFRDVVSWAKEVETRGAGEILLQSIDKDGKQQGFDLEIAEHVVSSVNIPVVISSGAGSLENIKTLIKTVSPSGVAISSILHYRKTTIKDIRQYLIENIARKGDE
jgi:imidazole glycerol-phosphate synthase subunit HisF